MSCFTKVGTHKNEEGSKDSQRSQGSAKCIGDCPITPSYSSGNVVCSGVSGRRCGGPAALLGTGSA